MGSGSAEYRKLFPQHRITSILTCLLEAGEKLQKKTSSDHEDHLTRRLFARLIELPIFRDGPLGIDLQPEILSSDLDADTPSGRIDIKVSCDKGYQVYFAIEAKRLRTIFPKGKRFAGNSEYVNDGMMRFVTGQYAPFMKTGAMLGYVFDGNIEKAQKGINKYIQRKVKELKLKSPERLVPSKILPKNLINETHHALLNRDFLIYHIFIAV